MMIVIIADCALLGMKSIPKAVRSILVDRNLGSSETLSLLSSRQEHL
jgi:hypothetical protein